MTQHIEIVAVEGVQWKNFFAALPSWKKEYLALRGCTEKGMPSGRQALLYSGVLVENVKEGAHDSAKQNAEMEHQLFVHLKDSEDIWGWSRASLVAGDVVSHHDGEPLHYVLNAEGMTAQHIEKAYLGWYMAHKEPSWADKNKHTPQLHMRHEAFLGSKEKGILLAQTINEARYWIDAPAEEMGPEELEHIISDMASQFAAELHITKGENLAREFPLIEAVGRASSRPPRLVELCWKGGDALSLCLIGKGVCFDSGGLNLKPSSAMRIMRKDMGGAAIVMALAKAIMALALPINLRMLVPLADNAISGNAFRAGDVFTARNGKRVEIGNTDAEGRLLLADCLTYGATTKPDLLLDVATLTGAARVAVGTDIAAFLSRSDVWSQRLAAAADKVEDPVWRLPLHDVYKSTLASKIADTTSCGESGYAGAITAALFLEEFIPLSMGDKWMHIDTMAWNLSSRPGRPEGGEAQSLRALLNMIETMLPSKSEKES